MQTERRFGGVARLYGVSAVQRIADAHVAVIGVGGVGSWAAEALARTGAGAITLIDLDHVSESNINRQIHAQEETLGQAKVLAMSDRIHSYHPGCRVTCVEAFVEATTWPDLLPVGVTAIIDACDQVSAKTAMAHWARHNPVHFISAGAAGGKRHAHLVEIGDLAHATHDPLLAQLRYRLRKEHGAPREGKRIGLACVYSPEAVQPPDPSCAFATDGTLNCHGYGSVVSVTATFGLCAAGWLLDRIAAGGQELRKV